MASSDPVDEPVGAAGDPPSPPLLELFEYIPQRALVVVAHPDDGEFLAGAVLSAWCRQGCRAAVCVVTDGDAGSDDPSIPAGELSRVRLQEQRLASAHLGVSEVRCLGHADGTLENTLAVRRDLVRMIREWRPEALITMDPGNRWFGRGYLNHPDHRAAGEAALDAAFPSARDARTFPELLRDEGLQPHKVRFVFLGATLATSWRPWGSIGARSRWATCVMRWSGRHAGVGPERASSWPSATGSSTWSRIPPSGATAGRRHPALAPSGCPGPRLRPASGVELELSPWSWAAG
jgi:LmbE family N-acetylglucosaminyl deacetylase